MDKLREKQAIEKAKEIEAMEKEVRFLEDEDYSEYLPDENTLEVEEQTIDRYDVDTGTQTGHGKTLWGEVQEGFNCCTKNRIKLYQNLLKIRNRNKYIYKS